MRHVDKIIPDLTNAFNDLPWPLEDARTKAVADALELCQCLSQVEKELGGLELAIGMPLTEAVRFNIGE